MTEKPPSVGVADSSPQGEPYRTADDRPYEVSAVWWWLEVINRYLCGELTILLFYIIIN